MIFMLLPVVLGLFSVIIWLFFLGSRLSGFLMTFLRGWWFGFVSLASRISTIIVISCWKKLLKNTTNRTRRRNN
ncbi:hypothetical protein LINGRAHAP2_LOCUS648 [Linum grandiflorum]